MRLETPLGTREQRICWSRGRNLPFCATAPHRGLWHNSFDARDRHRKKNRKAACSQREVRTCETYPARLCQSLVCSSAQSAALCRALQSRFMTLNSERSLVAGGCLPITGDEIHIFRFSFFQFFIFSFPLAQPDIIYLQRTSPPETD